MNIFEFEITIQRKYEDSWPVVVTIRQPDGLKTHVEGNFQLTETQFTELIKLQNKPKKYGTLLGKQLFKNDIEKAFDRSFGRSQSDSQDSFRILLSITANDDNLRALHWEWLCVHINGTWTLLSRNQSVLFSQYIPISTDIQRRFPSIGRRTLRVLILVASPSSLEGDYELTPFSVENVVSGLKRVFDNIPCDVLANNVEGAIGAPTLNELSRQLTISQKPYTLLHIVCHGLWKDENNDEDKDTVLYWATADNQVQIVTGTELIEELGNLKYGLPHFVFLCTCDSATPIAKGKAKAEFGGLAQRLVQELGIPAVVGMTSEVSIETALTLAKTFYQRLREYGEVDKALRQATAGLGDQADITVPALFSRLGGRPLFSDRLEGRELTDEEIEIGIEDFQKLLEERAPKALVLKQRFEQQVKILTKIKGAESRDALTQKRLALDEINNLCDQVLDGISFDALAALGKKPPEYKAECPFPGLLSFSEEKYHKFFFGRESLVKDLEKKLKKDSFLAVIGPSGSGKSSVVLAGLIPKLKDQDCCLKMTYLTPTDKPLEQLEKAKVRVNKQLTIFIVDQFEELFTLCTNKDQCKEFIEQLLILAQKQKVIITMRADFMGECTYYSKLSKRIEQSQKLIGPMELDELGKAMKMQADQVDLEFEDGLSNAILAEVEGEPGAMPLLQHTLRELWNRRRGKWLCHEEYNNIGGVRKAITKTANKFYDQLSEQNKERVKNIFLRLTHLDVNALQDGELRDTRQRVELETLTPINGDQEETRKLVNDLANIRLVITSENQVTKKPEVEVVHEVLIRYWEKLKDWLEEGRSNLLLRQSISQAATEWEKHQQEHYLVHQGGRLEDAEDLVKQHKSVNKLEIEYVKACRQLHNRQEQEKAESMSNSSLIVFDNHQELDALDLAIRAGNILQKEKIRENATRFLVVKALKKIVYKIKEYNRLEGHENWVISASFSPDGKIIATASQDKTVILWSIDGNKLRALKGHKREVFSVAFSPDGKFIATTIADKTVKLWNLDGQTIQTLTEQDNTVGCVSFSPNGKIIATANDSGVVTLWNFDGHRIREQPFQKFVVRSLKDVHNSYWFTRSICFSPDGQFLVTASRDSFIRFWKFDDNKEQLNAETIIHLSLQDEEVLPQLKPFLEKKASDDPDNGWIDSVCFSSNGKYLVTANKDKTAKLWSFDGESISLSRELKGHNEWVKSACFSSDGEIVATASHDQTVKLWNLDGQELQTLIGHQGWVNMVCFKPNSPGRKILATASDDTSVKLWKIPEQQLQSFKEHEKSIWNISFHPDGNIFATASDDKTVKLWKIENPENEQPFSVEVLQTLQAHSIGVSDACFSPDGNTIVTASDGTIKLWRFDGQKTQEAPLQILDKKHEPEGLNKHWTMRLCFSPNGKILASSGDGSKIKLWEFDGQKLQDEEFKTLKHDGIVMRLYFSPDSKIIATACRNRTAKLWNLNSNEPIATLEHDGWVRGVCFSPNGKIIATASDDRTVKLWNCGGTLQRVIKGHNDEIRDISFSRDGKIIATASVDKTVKLWNLNGEELHTLTGYKHAVECVSFVPIKSRNTIVTGTDSGLVSVRRLPSLDRWVNRLSDANLDELVEEACVWIKDYEEAKKTRLNAG